MDSEILEKPLNSESLQQILTFLKRNGLTEAEEVLSREAAVVLRLSKEPVDGLESGNDSVVHEFGALLSHVGASFDNFRSEFSALLFPIFAHLYIQLILDGSSVIAAKLAEKYAKSVPSYYEEQTNQLIRITNHGQAANHPLVHALTKNQFVVKLSKSAIKQLEPLLARHQIIKDVIRDHFLIEPVDGSRSKVAIEANMGGILGQISKLERKHKMFYGTMKEDLSTQLGIDKKRLKGKDKSDGKKKDANGPAPDRIPLPTITDKRLLSKDGGKKVRISIDSPPSVCLYTVLNGHGGVTAAEFSEDSTMIAAGYGNSDIQVSMLKT
ncbi:hypothetical protein AB6A40_000060 [Gnathostoma spinigerum]|uniref:TFIID subunit TAF5 NTD2 domain-containing protein n=1 Tax=Gnathostoma spinigerum TaxID=75299 RepID=A0ABD6E3B0_9BILA